MFTKIGVTVASGTLPVLLWVGAASGQQSTQSAVTDPCQSQSQSQLQSQCVTSTVATTVNTIPVSTGGSGGGTLARTGINDLLPLALGGIALGGAVVVRRGRRSLA